MVVPNDGRVPVPRRVQDDLAERERFETVHIRKVTR